MCLAICILRWNTSKWEFNYIIIIIICWWYQNFLHCKLPTDSTLPQPNVDSIRIRCAADVILTKLKLSPLQGKIIQLITFTNCVINPQLILTASNIWEFFGYCILYSSLKMLWLIQALTYCFCTVDCVLLLYFVLFRSKLEYTLPAWNIVTTNANQMECSKWKFAAISLSNFSSHIPYNYAVALELLQLHAVQVTRHHFNALCLVIHVFPISKFYPAMIDSSSLWVPSCNIRNFTQFSAGHKICPSTRCCKFGMQWYRYRHIE